MTSNEIKKNGEIPNKKIGARSEEKRRAIKNALEEAE